MPTFLPGKLCSMTHWRVTKTLCHRPLRPAVLATAPAAPGERKPAAPVWTGANMAKDHPMISGATRFLSSVVLRLAPPKRENGFQSSKSK